MSSILEWLRTEPLGDEDLRGTSLDLNPYSLEDLKQVLSVDIVNKLGVENLPPYILASLSQSRWYAVEGGNHFLEIRNHDILRKPSEGVAEITDFDDVILQTSRWHGEEIGHISQFFAEKGLTLGVEVAKHIYELSKINIPELAEVQKRYTPALNLFLLSQLFVKLTEGLSLEAALGDIQALRDALQVVVSSVGEDILGLLNCSEEIFQLMISNDPANFVNEPFVEDLFSWQGDRSEDGTLRIIVTRGKIGGPLGQVHKVHATGIMRLPSVDAVVYTNDVKIRALLLLLNVFPGMRNRLIRFYDDNPADIVPFYSHMVAQGIPLPRIELVHVRHPTAKRRDKPVVIGDDDAQVLLTPELSIGNTSSGDTVFDHYLPTDKSVIHVL